MGIPNHLWVCASKLLTRYVKEFLNRIFLNTVEFAYNDTEYSDNPGTTISSNVLI